MIAELGEGTPAVLVLSGRREHGIDGVVVLTADQHNLIDQLVAVARAPWIALELPYRVLGQGVVDAGRKWGAGRATPGWRGSAIAKGRGGGPPDSPLDRAVEGGTEALNGRVRPPFPAVSGPEWTTRRWSGLSQAF